MDGPWVPQRTLLNSGKVGAEVLEARGARILEPSLPGASCLECSGLRASSRTYALSGRGPKEDPRGYPGKAPNCSGGVLPASAAGTERRR